MNRKNILLLLAVVLELAAVICVVFSMMDRITAALQALLAFLDEKKDVLCQKCRIPCREDGYEDWDEFEDWEI